MKLVQNFLSQIKFASVLVIITGGCVYIAVVTRILFNNKSWQRDLPNLNWIVILPHIHKIICRPSILERIMLIKLKLN